MSGHGRGPWDKSCDLFKKLVSGTVVILAIIWFYSAILYMA